jgi:hypothetical protein
MKLSKISFTSIIAITAIVGCLMLHHWIQAKYSENNNALQFQRNQLTELATENQRLSNLVLQLKTNSLPLEDEKAELARLQAKAVALRKETSQMATQLEKNRRLAGAQLYSLGDSSLLEHNLEIAGSVEGGPRATGKLNDARALTTALNKYANEHHGVFPSSFDQVTSYLPKPLDADSGSWMDTPLSGTNSFEIVFQGSQNDLTNLPLRRIALIREQQPWLTSDGKWARVYGLADCMTTTVVSDDNFQSWDAQHIIPPASARQQ